MINVKEIAINYLAELKTAIDAIDLEEIQKISNVLLGAYKNEKTVYIIGNGGSASTASHMACDFGKGTLKNVYNQREKRLKVISLTDNVATMTAYANDLSYDDIFAQQLNNLIVPGDVVIGITGSGNSPNIIKAMLRAKEQGAITIGLLGFFEGGKTKEFCDLNVIIQSHNYGVIEDLHLSLNHLLSLCLAYMKKQLDSTIVNRKVVKNHYKNGRPHP